MPGKCLSAYRVASKRIDTLWRWRSEVLTKGGSGKRSGAERQGRHADKADKKEDTWIKGDIARLGARVGAAAVHGDRYLGEVI